MQKNVIYLVNSTENSSDCIFLRTSHFSIAIYNYLFYYLIFLLSYYFYILSRLFQVINLPYKFTLKNTESLSSCFIPRYLLVISYDE